MDAAMLRETKLRHQSGVFSQCERLSHGMITLICTRYLSLWIMLCLADLLIKTLTSIERRFEDRWFQLLRGANKPTLIPRFKKTDPSINVQESFRKIYQVIFSEVQPRWYPFHRNGFESPLGSCKSSGIEIEKAGTHELHQLRECTCFRQSIHDHDFCWEMVDIPDATTDSIFSQREN